MSAACPDEVSLLEWLDAPSEEGHVGGCPDCARVLEDLRRVRTLARALGRHLDDRHEAGWPPAVPPARAARASSPRRWRGLGAAQRLASTAAALALFAAIGAEPLLRRRIDDAPRRHVEASAGAAAGTVFFTSVAGGALAARVGR